MEHAKKMVLVPQETVHRMTGSIAPLTSSSQILSDLDKEMENILRTPMKSDSEKWTLYKQCLRRFLHFSAEERKPLAFPIEQAPENNPGGNGVTEIKGSEQEIPLHTEIVSSLPQKYRKKAELLISRLLSSGKISWNSDGTVSIKGGVIPGSNITDLVGDVMRSRKNVNPKGIDSFASLLTEINMPKEFIGNPKRLNLIQRYDSVAISRTEETGSAKRSRTTSLKSISNPEKSEALSRWTPYRFKR